MAGLFGYQLQKQAPKIRSGGVASPGFTARTVLAAKALSTPKQTLTPDATNLLPSLAGVLRRESVGNWLMPYMSAITPSYIESVIRGGLAGNHVQMHQLFDLMWDTDPEIQSCIGEFQEGVLSKRVVIEAYHDEDEEPTPSAVEKAKMFSAAIRSMRPDAASDECDLRGIIKDLLAARFHGQSLIELDWYQTYGTGELNLLTLPGFDGQVLVPRAGYWVNPVCYAWDQGGRLKLLMPPQVARDKTGTIKKMKFDPKAALTEGGFYSTVSGTMLPNQFVEFPPNKFLIGIDKSKTGSVLASSQLRCLAWWWCASNFCGDFLMATAQLFGVPFRKATYKPGVSENQKEEIRQMLQAMGSQAWALVPEGVEIAFETATGTGGQSPQAFLFHFADSQKRKVILHQTMTGGQHDSMGKGGGKAFGETESDVKDTCIDAGATYVASVINLQLIPYFLAVNFGEGGDMEAPVCKLVDVKEGGLTDAQRDSALVQIMDVPESHLYRKYGIPKPQEGEPIAGVDTGVLGAQAAAQEKQQAQQQKTQQANAKAALAQSQQGQQQQEQPSGSDDANEAAAARVELALKASNALQATITPILVRLEAIRAVEDVVVKKGMLTKFLRDLPGIEAAVAADPGLAQALEAAAARPSSAGKFGCLMAMAPQSVAKQIVAFGKKAVKDGTLAADGLDAEPHVTILFGFNPGFDPSKITNVFSDHGPVTFTLGNLSRFECPEYDVLKFDIVSPGAEALHDSLAKELAADITPSKYEYHPHLTVAYV
jgi:phage gp29-like protein